MFWSPCLSCSCRDEYTQPSEISQLHVVFPMPPHVPYGLHGLPSRLWPGDAQVQLRCPDEVHGDI
jgi:hypothetical protein